MIRRKNFMLYPTIVRCTTQIRLINDTKTFARLLCFYKSITKEIAPSVSLAVLRFNFQTVSPQSSFILFCPRLLITYKVRIMNHAAPQENLRTTRYIAMKSWTEDGKAAQVCRNNIKGWLGTDCTRGAGTMNGSHFILYIGIIRTDVQNKRVCLPRELL